MDLIALLKRVLPFFAGFALGIAPIWIGGLFSGNGGSSDIGSTTTVPFYYGSGGGIATGCHGPEFGPKAEPEFRDKGKLRIISKPRPAYTPEARENNVQGTVVLRVTFLASGQIGDVQTISGLPSGLTDEAVTAARRIIFEPAELGGRPVAVTKQIEYSFSIY
ncbi:hypothetical protein BH10ACI2_BH10ACI2_20930 [soil metagenome]